MEIKVEGLDKLMTKLSRLNGNADAALKKGLMQSGKFVQAAAKEKVPEDTGQLRNSIVVTDKESYSFRFTI